MSEPIREKSVDVSGRIYNAAFLILERMIFRDHWQVRQRFQLARRRLSWSRSSALSIATAMMAVFADRFSPGHTTTYCRSMRAMWRMILCSSWSKTMHQGSPTSVWLHSSFQ